LEGRPEKPTDLEVEVVDALSLEVSSVSADTCRKTPHKEGIGTRENGQGGDRTMCRATYQTMA